MEAEFNFGGLRVRVGNNIVPDDGNMTQSRGFIGLVVSKEAPFLGDCQRMTVAFASMQPHEARALASVLMSAVTESRS